MGLDSKLFQLGSSELSEANHHDEVQTATIYRGQTPTGHDCGDANHSQCTHHQEFTDCGHDHDDNSVVPESRLTEALTTLSKESVWRVKGFVRLESGYHILNWAFGRYELIPLSSASEHTGSVKLTIMGEQGEVKRAARKLATAIDANVVE